MSGMLELVTVFAARKDGFPVCRIPSLLAAADGTLLAFCEGRQDGGDHASNRIVLKRSHDGGRTWEPARVIAAAGADSLNDPSAALDRRTGRLVLHYARFAAGFHTDKAVPGYDHPRASANYVIVSDDAGASWSAPSEVTRQVKRPTVRCTVVTCGIGIQLRRGPHAGRLVHAAYQFGGRHEHEAYAVFSDDGGTTWRMGAVAAGTDWAAEPQVVELADGRVMMNVRTRTGCRKVAFSADGGSTFTDLADDPALIEPGCQASIFRAGDPLDGQPSLLLFSNPASRTERVSGTVRLSLDEGATWPLARPLYRGGFAYSCLGMLPDGTLLCLFEADEYQRIVLARFAPAWLQAGQTRS